MKQLIKWLSKFTSKNECVLRMVVEDYHGDEYSVTGFTIKDGELRIQTGDYI